MHLLVDSTGLKLCGAGEWLVEKHGTRTRRSWRKLHLGVDADTGQIVASALTTKDVDDGTQTDPLLDQIDGTIGSFTGDGAYDQEGVYASVTKRHPEAAVIVPPRSSAVLSADAETAPTQPTAISSASPSTGAWDGSSDPGTTNALGPRPPSGGGNR
jgi:hypothetical protein